MSRAMTILRKELRDTLRDRRTLVVMILMPVILMPLLLVGIVKIEEWSEHSRQTSIVRVMVKGAGEAPELVKRLQSDGRIRLTGSGEPVELLKQAEIDAYLEIPDGFEETVEAGGSAQVLLLTNSTRGNSGLAESRVDLCLSSYSAGVVERRLGKFGESTAVLDVVTVRSEDTATEKEKGGAFLGYLLPMFLVIFALVGGMYTAMDISAGEKERKTIEALLMTPATRAEIVAGKFLAVAAVSVVTIVLSVASLFVSARFVSGSLGSADLTLDAVTLAIMVPVALLLAAMFAAVLLAASTFARSYKEAQNYVTPIYVLAVLPIVIANSVVSSGASNFLFVIPGFNAVLLFRELLLGDYAATHILITVASLLAFTVQAVRFAVRIYSREDVLIDGGAEGKRKWSFLPWSPRR